MRFIWKLIKRDTGIPVSHEKMAMQAASESQEAVQGAAKNREHLKGYLERTQKVTAQEKKQFNDQLTDWYKGGDKVSMRMGGVSESENDKDYLARHARLSSAFVKWDKNSKRISGSVNFTNDTAENKVGLGDVLPPIVKVVKVKKKNGEIVDCVRTQNPRTGRIGYYETGSLSKGQYAYVAIHSGDSFEVMRTVDPKDPKAQRDILREHVMVYRGKAMEADEGEEAYYDGYGKPLRGTPGARRAQGKAQIQSGGSKRRAGFQKALGSLGVRPTSRKNPRKKQTIWSKARGPRKSLKAAPRISYGGQTVEVAGKRYQKLTRRFLEQFIGTTPEKTSRWLVQTSFMGQPVRVSPLVLPYLKEAEARMKAEGVEYKMKKSAGGCSCYNHRGIRKLDGSTSKTLSKHSWGIALDINPGDHPFGKSWAQNNNPDKIPMKMVRIMQESGFRWGDSFKNRDPMHFELAVNPFTSQDIIKTDAGKRALATLENFAGGLGGQARETWAKAKQQKKSGAAPKKLAYGGGSGSVVPKESPSPRNPSRVSAASIEKAVGKYNEFIYEAAEKYNVPANLIKTVMWQESGGRPLLASHAGAGGLMQFMPATARGYGLKPILPMIITKNSRGRKIYRIDPRDGRANPRAIIMASGKLLSWLLKKYKGDVRTALSAYNWGPGNVAKYFKGQKRMPEETAFYYKNITAQKEKLDSMNPQNA